MKKLSVILGSSLLGLSMAAPVWSNSVVEAVAEANVEGAVTATTSSASVDASGSVSVNGSASSDAKVAVRDRIKSEIKHKAALATQLKDQAKTEAGVRIDATAQTKAVVELQTKAQVETHIDATMSANAEAQAQAKAEITELMVKADHSKAHIEATLATYENLIKQGLSNQQAMVVIEGYIDAGADMDAVTEIAASFDTAIDLNLSHDEVVASFSALSDFEAYTSVDSLRGELSLPDISDLVNADINAETSGSYDGSSAGGSFEFETGAGVEMMR